MIKESKYIIRRVIIGVLIALILSFISSCEVHAEVKPLDNVSLKGRYYPSSNWVNINYNQWQTSPSSNSLYGLQMIFEPGYGDNYTYYPIGAGTYLFDFYIQTNHLTDHLANCNGLNTNFEFQDSTTGTWHSSASNSSSSCIDSYYTLTGGNRTIHYLIQWQVTDTFTYALNISQMRFTFYNFTGSGFTIYDGSYYVILGTLQDYSSDIVADFKKIANDNTNTQNIINNQNTNTQNIINNQNQNQAQNHQDSLNEQNAINQNTQAQNETNDILEDSSIPSDSNSKINDIISQTQTQNANISELVNFIPNTLQVIINGFNNSCTGGYSLGSLFGTELTIPCINPVDYLGSFLWGVIDSILCLCYLIPLCKFLVNKYNDLTSLKNLRWQ